MVNKFNDTDFKFLKFRRQQIPNKSLLVYNIYI